MLPPKQLIQNDKMSGGKNISKMSDVCDMSFFCFGNFADWILPFHCNGFGKHVCFSCLKF